MSRSTSQRIVIVGGGISGLGVAARLAQSGLPVTLLEAGRLGGKASTQNQGWLHSGAWFARAQPELAHACYQSLEQTVTFCPACAEPGAEGMAYFVSRPDTPMDEWTEAWQAAGIPWEDFSRTRFLAAMPKVDVDRVHHVFMLPDRAIRPDVLLKHLAATAQDFGAEVRTKSPVPELLYDDDRVVGVKTTGGEEIRARLVILAAGASSTSLAGNDFTAGTDGEPKSRSLVTLKGHLMAIAPPVGSLPFCAIDCEGLNHVPHESSSVFGVNRWLPVSGPTDHDVDDAEVERLWSHIREFFPLLNRRETTVVQWAGTAVHAMPADQVEVDYVPLPTVIDHEQLTRPARNLLSVFPGRATLWARLAEETRNVVLEKLEFRETSPARPPWL